MKLRTNETVGLTNNMALEVVRSAVKLDHIYAKEDEDITDLGKDVILSEAFDSLVSISGQNSCVYVEDCGCLACQLSRTHFYPRIILITDNILIFYLILCVSFVNMSNIEGCLHEKIEYFECIMQ